MGVAALAAAALMQSCGEPACAPLPPPPAPEAPPPPPPDITSITIDGQGNGHGRGMSAWGAYSLAANWGWSWQGILDYYYGGTTWGTAANIPIGVRLLALDNAATTGVISTNRTAVWNGVGYASLQAAHQGFNQYDIWGSSVVDCSGQVPGWTYLGRVAGPVTFTTWQDQTGAAPGDVLGVCQPDGSVIHYRGSITARNDGAGFTRTVNELAVENYIKGVLPREVPASWGYSGGGAGMNALWAFAVATRSFGLSQNRYGYARTCDSQACQVYGGSAFRSDPSAPPTVREHPNTNRAADETAGVIRVWPGNGAIVSTQYSASHGPRSAGGPFPVVDDWFSDVPGNPLYTWSRTIPAEDLEVRYGLGNLVGAYTERDPASVYDGVWGQRVVLQGTAATVVVPNLDFRNTYGFPSHGFSVSGVTR